MLTQTYLKELLDYNLITGIFTWKVKPSKIVNIGDIAGTKHLGYTRILIKRKAYLAHRLAVLYITGYFPLKDVDHINHNRSDNHWINLRNATKQLNQQNSSKRIDNSSGICGVAWHKKTTKWQANIKQKYLGTFIEKWDAICARKSAEYKHNFHINHGR